MAGSLIFNEVYPFNLVNQLTDADATNLVQMLGVGQFARRLDQVSLSNNDTIDHVVALVVSLNAVAARVACVNVPAGSGFAGVPPVEVYPATSATPVGGLVVDVNALLYVTLEVALNTGKVLQVFASGGTL